MKNQTAKEIAMEYKRLHDNWLNQYIQLRTLRPFETLAVHVRAINTFGTLSEVWQNVSKREVYTDYEEDYYEDREPLD